MYEFVPVDWDVRKLGDFATVVSKRFSKKSNAPILSMTKYDGFVKSLEYFNKQVFSNDISNYKLVEKNDFAYATIHLDEGSIGLLKNFKNGYISPMYTVFQVDPTVDKNYLILLMKTKQYLYKYEALGEGTVDRRKSVKFTELSKLKMSLPSLSEQEKIAKILSNINDLILNRDKIINQTKSLKQGLMQKLLTKGIGHKKFKQVKWLFGKEIKIPEEWKIKIMSETGIFINGLNKEKEDYGHGCLHVNINNIFESFSIVPAKLGRVNATKKEIETYALQKGDICILRSSVKREGVGYPALFDGSDIPIVFSGFIIRFRPDHVWDSTYLTFLLRLDLMRNSVVSKSSSSANTNINQKSLGSILIPVPAITEQQKIASILSNIDSQIQSQTKYKEKLERLKKSLMQKLLTGEVRVKV